MKSRSANAHRALIALAVLGGWWCGAIIQRMPADLEQVRSGEDRVQSAVIIAYWVLTVPIAIATLWCAWRAVAGVIRLVI